MDNRLYLNDAAELVDDPAMLAELAGYTTRERCAIGEALVRKLEKDGKPAPPRMRRALDESGQSNRCRGRITESRSAPAVRESGTARTFTESNVSTAGATPAARASIAAMSPDARRRLASNLNEMLGSRARTHTEAAPSPTPAPRQRRTPTEARELLVKEANDAAFHNGMSFTMAYITAAEALPDVASDAGVDPAAIRRNHALPARA